MRLLWIGYGQAGGKLANTFVGMEAVSREKLCHGIAINTEEADFAGLNRIREKVTIGRYKQKGRGVGANIELGAEIAQKSLSQMLDGIDKLNRRLEPEAFWIVAGLSGGTGAGGAHVLARELKTTYGKPVYGLGVLPSATGMPAEKEVLYLSNALKSLESWRRCFDNILLLDNQQYELGEKTRESVEKMYGRINKDVARRLTLLLTAGGAKYPPQEVFDASELKATLGKDGQISTIGYRGESLRSRTRFWRKGIEPNARRLEEFIEESINVRRLTFPCDISGSKAAALVPYGRPEHLFAQAILAGKAHLEQEMKIGEVRYGDYPDRRGTELAVATLISGITDFSRLEQMRKRIEKRIEEVT